MMADVVALAILILFCAVVVGITFAVNENIALRKRKRHGRYR